MRSKMDLSYHLGNCWWSLHAVQGDLYLGERVMINENIPGKRLCRYEQKSSEYCIGSGNNETELRSWISNGVNTDWFV